MENNQHPTPHDKEIKSSLDELARLRDAAEDYQDKVVKVRRKALEKDISNGMGIRDAWQQAEKEMAKRYDPAIYDFWRTVGWVNHAASQSKNEPDAMVIMHKDGGHIKVSPSEVNYHGEAKNDHAAIEKGVLHAGRWKNGMDIDGDETFKATAWAYAQMHGVKINNYTPTGESRDLAQRIIVEKMAGLGNSQQNPLPGTQPLSIDQTQQSVTKNSVNVVPPINVNKPDDVKPVADAAAKQDDKSQTYKPDWVLVDDGVQHSAAPLRRKPRVNYPLAVRPDKEVIAAYNNDRQALLPAKAQPLLLTGAAAKDDATTIAYTDYKPNWVIVRPESPVARASSVIIDPKPTDIIISHGGQQSAAPPPQKQLRLPGPKRVGAGTVIAL
jgi:hypothetical protein